MSSIPDIDAWIERQLTDVPPLTDEQIARLRLLFWAPGAVGAADRVGIVETIRAAA